MLHREDELFLPPREQIHVEHACLRTRAGHFGRLESPWCQHAALNNSKFLFYWTLCKQVAMRLDLSELEDMCSDVQGLQASAKAAYEDVLAYFGENTNSTPSGASSLKK